MHKVDCSQSVARIFEVFCEPNLQVARQLTYTDQPIELYFDPTCRKCWVRVLATFPNGKQATVVEQQIGRGVTFCLILPAKSHLGIVWITKPDLVALARQDAAKWPMLSAK